VNALRDPVMSEVSERAAPKIHAWRIEERENARHEQRRGRRHAFERIEPERTALVVVDMVSFFVEENEYCRGIVPNIQNLASCLRAAGGAVAWVLPCHGEPTARDEEFLGPDVAQMYSASGGLGSPRERLWREFELSDSDIVVEKTAASAFFPDRSPLPAILQAREIDTVLITGTVTNVCCESSARDASTLGYRVVMVADANAARRDHDHNATLHTIYRCFGDVRSTADVIDLVQAARR
jgi:ureidoacrylate peracid hydrolase